jgi:PAS domain S-box-containing protein
VLEKRRLELEVKKTKDFLKGIIESSPDSIITTDLEGRITSFNRGAEEIFGYKAGEVLGRSILDFYPPMLRATREKWIEELKKGGAVRNKRIRLYGKKKRPVDLSLSAALLRGAGEAPAGVVEIGRDISGEVKAEEEMMRKFLKYKIELGNVYLVKERKPEKAVDVFLDMVSCGYKGAVISRDHLEEVKKSSFDVKFLWLAEREYSNAIYPAPRAILRAMEELLAMNKTILLDRLDYLIARQGFKNVLRLVQELRELFYVERGVLIISLDPGTLHGRELRLLEKETREVKLRKAPAFPEDLRELLRFVYQQNKLGVKPPYKEVAKKLGVTRTTARRKIRELRAKGLLTEAKKGRFKVLEITPEGLEYF